MKRDEPSPAPEPLAWQDRVGFHAALLLHFHGDGAAAMRRVGQLVYDMAIQTEPPGDRTRRTRPSESAVPPWWIWSCCATTSAASERRAPSSPWTCWRPGSASWRRSAAKELAGSSTLYRPGSARPESVRRLALRLNGGLRAGSPALLRRVLGPRRKRMSAIWKILHEGRAWTGEEMRQRLDLLPEKGDPRSSPASRCSARAGRFLRW